MRFGIFEVKSLIYIFYISRFTTSKQFLHHPLPLLHPILVRSIRRWRVVLHFFCRGDTKGMGVGLAEGEKISISPPPCYLPNGGWGRGRLYTSHRGERVGEGGEVRVLRSPPY